MSKIAFFGLGNMGGPMAANLLHAGHTVTGFDPVAAAVESFVAAGGKAADSVEQACLNVDVVVSMLPSDQLVEELYLGPKGILAALNKRSCLLIDSSTISPQASRKVSQAATQHGSRMIDAPVSGGVGGAKAGTLTFMVGGLPDVVAEAEKILQAMGKNIFHAGPAGSGQVVKICNNMLLAIHMIGTSEALNLGVALGMEPKVLSDIMSKSSGRNWSLEVYNPYPGVMENAPASRQYSGGFAVDLMAKDLGLALAASQSAQTATPLGHLARDLFAMWSKLGHGGQDFSSILQLLTPTKAVSA
jgi:3-hydroxyisobutyrate dehydrogenase